MILDTISDSFTTLTCTMILGEGVQDFKGFYKIF